MYRVLQQLGPDDPEEIFDDENPKLALAVCLRPPEKHQFLGAAFPGNPPETIELETVSLDYLVTEIEKGRLFVAHFHRPGDNYGVHNKHQLIRKR